jgi:hypothetical protein
LQNGSRTYLGTFTEKQANNTGLQHPYGLAFNLQGSVL